MAESLERNHRPLGMPKGPDNKPAQTAHAPIEQRVVLYPVSEWPDSYVLSHYRTTAAFISSLESGGSDPAKLREELREAETVILNRGLEVPVLRVNPPTNGMTGPG